MPAGPGLALPPHHVARPRLVRRLVGAAVSVIEAPAGYGKSVLAAELSAALGIPHPWVALAPADDDVATLAGSVRRALKVGRLSDLSAVLISAGPSTWADRLLDALADVGEPLLLILDDAHHLAAEDCAAAVLRLASGMPPPHRLVLTARQLPAQLEPVRAILGVCHLGPSDLAFRPDEAARLIEALRGGLPGGEHLAEMFEAAGGWASALVLTATAPYESSGPSGPAVGVRAHGGADGRTDGGAAGGHRPVPGAAVIGAAVTGILVRLSVAERSALTQLAHLPYLSPQVVEEVTGQQATFDRLVRAGVPLARVASGWWEMPARSPLTSPGRPRWTRGRPWPRRRLTPARATWCWHCGC
jgi:hypothetical protein